MDTKIKNTTRKPEKQQRKHVFIIGSKGIPAMYGGFESFVEKLTFYQKSHDIQYHVSCIVDSKEYDPSKKVFTHNGAKCINIKAMDIGAAKAITYDIDALKYFIAYAMKYNLHHPIFYILACRIGPFIGYYKRQIEKLGGNLYVNPDGHEWKRAKWSAPVRKYWKISERLMVKHAELLICDSKNIEKYIQEDYRRYSPNTTFIAYGAETSKSELANYDPKVVDWYNEKGVKLKEYYLLVGRFVPENNFETMVKEFMKSTTKKDFVLITGIEGVPLYNKLKAATGFDKDRRIKFVGTVYDQELLKKIRENAYGYIHGHEVGGTNPSLLEALGSTGLNLLLDVGFNHEVGEEGALYWTKEDQSLASLINEADSMTADEIEAISKLAKKRITDCYSWDYIVSQYEKYFGEHKMGMNKFYAVVVLYNRSVSDSITCKNLLTVKRHNINVIIADNSTVQTNNITQCLQNKWMYISMNGNVGLSKAYNKVLDTLNEQDGVVIWFDDDTNISQEYFDQLDIYLGKFQETDIFAPVIYGQDGKIYSPNEARFFKNKQLKKPVDPLNLKRFNAINSCTAVRLSVYENYRYDERIFLDQVDHNFFEDQRNLGRKFCKLDVVIHHNFSLKSKQDDPEKVWSRYEIMIPDFMMFCSKSKKRLILGMVKVLGWGIRECLTYKDFRFFWRCFRCGIKSFKKLWSVSL